MPRDLRTLLKEMRGPDFDADTDSLRDIHNRVSAITFVSGKINAVTSGTIVINDKFTKVHYF